jgi:hypothetical protein
LPINFEIFYQSILAAGFLVPMLPPVGWSDPLWAVVFATGTAAFAADCLLQAHSTPLPRLFLVELTQYPGDDMIRSVQDTARIHKASLLHWFMGHMGVS